jgi:hypothetical protein
MTGYSSDQPTHLDGNGAAGLLREVFAVEMTTASCTCVACGADSEVGALHLYGGAIGTVLRCPSCEALVLCITSVRTGYFMELRGVLHIRATGAGEARTA